MNFCPCSRATHVPASVLAFAIGCTAPAQERETPLATDRPGVLFSPFLVPEHGFQVEVGAPSFLWSKGKGLDVESFTAGASLRYGLSESMELRASPPTWTNLRVDAGGEVERSDGFGDLEIGAKWAVDSDPANPRSLLGSLRLPTGEDPFSTGEIGLSAYYLAGRDVGGSTWLQGALGVTHTPFDGGNDQTSGTIAASFSRPLGNDAGAYLEFAAFPGLSHAPGQTLVGCGFTYAALDTLQFDAWLQVGLDPDIPDWMGGVGISWRF